jgi:hypothetical protein
MSTKSTINFPDWKNAPEWANYVAKNKNGVWCWYENMPSTHPSLEEWIDNGGKYQEISWRDSLQKRPSET